MTTQEEFEKRWHGLLPIGVVEHHLLRHSGLSVYDISDRLLSLHESLLQSPDAVSLEPASILQLNGQIASALAQPTGTFEQLESWQALVAAMDDGGGMAESSGHFTGWIFSSLYWEHLTICRFATAWFVTDAQRAQHGLPKLRLLTRDLGRFLNSLSGSGPPTYDGQTFFPDTY